LESHPCDECGVKPTFDSKGVPKIHITEGEDRVNVSVEIQNISASIKKLPALNNESGDLGLAVGL